MELGAFLSAEIWRTALVFSRVGAAMMLLPGFGEMAVPARTRLVAALVVALALVNVVPGLPASVPVVPSQMVRQLFGEMAMGLFLGTGARLFLASLQATGQIIGQIVALSNVFGMQGTGFEGGATISGVLVIGALAFIFAADLHHLMILALLRSYSLLPVGGFPDMADLALGMARLVSRTFALSVQFAAPFLALGLLVNLGLGLVNRMMPALPVFFIGTPALIAGGLALVLLTAGAVVTALATHMAGWLTTLAF